MNETQIMRCGDYIVLFLVAVWFPIQAAGLLAVVFAVLQGIENEERYV